MVSLESFELEEEKLRLSQGSVKHPITPYVLAKCLVVVVVESEKLGVISSITG